MVSVISHPNPKVMSLSEILAELFYNDETPLTLLKKHDLEDLFEKSIQVIKVEIEKKPIDFGKFRDIASNVLITVNTKLRQIPDPLERRYMELILKEVAEHLLQRVTKSSANAGRLMSEIRSALETTASLKGYNFEALVALLKLNKTTSRFLSPRLSGVFHYNWNGSEPDLSELIQNLKSEGWISSTKEFRKLFNNHEDENLQVQFNRDKLYDLIALFDVLKEQRLITPKGCRGHFYPLKRYLVDFENKVLLERDPKTIRMIARRNVKNWDRLVKNASSWLTGFRSKSQSKLPSPR